jgi:hypothetical protein
MILSLSLRRFRRTSKISLYYSFVIDFGGSVDIATGYSLEGQGSILDRGKRFLCTPQRPPDSGAHPSFYPVGTGGFFPRVKVTGA